MDRLGVGAAFAISGLIIFVSSGSVGDKGIINEAINAFLVDSHPFAGGADWIRSNDVGDAYVGFVDFISGEARKIRRSEPAKTKRQKQR